MGSWARARACRCARRRTGRTRQHRGARVRDGTCPASSPRATHAAGNRLIVWAIEEGRRCAEAVDAWLCSTASSPSRPRSGDEARPPRRLPLDAGDDQSYAFELWHRAISARDRRRVAPRGPRQSVRDDRAERVRLVEQRRQGGRAPAARPGEPRKTASPVPVPRRPRPSRAGPPSGWSSACRPGRTRTAGRRRLEEWRRPARHPSAATVAGSSASWKRRARRGRLRDAPTGTRRRAAAPMARCEKTAAGLLARLN